ncbi:hypothetical protein [Cupriavidus sp. 8B]
MLAESPVPQRQQPDACGHSCWYHELEIERPPLPYVEAWYERLKQRPAYREHLMVPFDEWRGRLDY